MCDVWSNFSKLMALYFYLFSYLISFGEFGLCGNAVVNIGAIAHALGCIICLNGAYIWKITFVSHKYLTKPLQMKRMEPNCRKKDYG